MKSIQEFVLTLQQLDVKIWLEGDRLRCNAPKGILTAELREELANRKTEIIQFLQRNSFQTIKPIPRTENLPLSFSQQRLWFLSQLEPTSSMYNESGILKLEGNLNKVALEQSWQEIVKRHQVLRTTFKNIEGFTQQIVDPNPRVNISLVDLQELPENEQSVEIPKLLIQEIQGVFDLEQGPLWRMQLLQLGAKRYILLLTMHHIICDGWSFGIIIHELSTLYSAFSSGNLSPLKELPIQYTDFAYWQRQWLQGEILETQLNYWKEKLAGIPSLLDLPTDRPRPSIQTFVGGRLFFSLSGEMTQKLKLLSQQLGVTLFMSLLTTFAILLSRYSGQKDIVIGSPIAGRNRQEIESLIGFFVNTLVMRVNIEENPTVEELLKQVRKTCLEAYAHQDVPFEKLVEELKPERNMSHSPLFQVMFVLQNAPMEELSLPQLTLSPIEIEYNIAKFDLTLSMSETESGLIGNWEYNTDLFERQTIERMMEHFQVLLEGIVTNPQEKVGQLPILTEREKQKILVEWNDTAAEYSKNKCVHQLFEEQVERTPDAVAVVYKEEQLTYQELNQKANQLAHYLIRLGVKPDTLVGICVERSLEMVIGLLGILKAGGAYVPIDPSYPTERVQYMLEDSAVSVVLTQEKLRETLSQTQAQKICLDRNWLTINQENNNNIFSRVNEENLVYVIYTSGSTGKPKGVMIEHKGLMNYLTWCLHYYKVAQGNGSPVQSSLSFDATITSLYSPLLTGKTVTLLSEENELEELNQYLRASNGFSLVKITPAHLEIINQSIAHHEAANQTNAFILGGEALLGKQVEFWRKNAPKTKIINEYGPTETVVGCCIYEVDNLTDLSQPIPIGRPIANTQLYILDGQQLPVPQGVIGELYIGGTGVARGYLNRAKLTAEKFISNPFDTTGQSKLYKTGDLCRYLPNGNIEYIGRIDHQVKIRGFRIELGEIESLLGAHPEIRETIVIAREDQPGNKQLVAYLVSEALSQASVSQILRDYLKGRLPNYMVPSVFVLLEKLPLTPNGKIDRRALPNPETLNLGVDKELLAPRDPVEQKLVQIWENLLKVSPLGIKDNFFELGGHSLLAVQLMAQIQRDFEVNLPLATLFQSPTIEQLAQLLTSKTKSLSWSSLVPIQPLGTKPPFFCVPGAGGNVIYFYNLARHLGKEQPFYALQGVGLDGESTPYTRIEEVATHYIQVMRTVHPNGPYYLGGHSYGGRVAFEIANQLQQQGQEVSLVAIFDSPSPGRSESSGRAHWDDTDWIVTISEAVSELFNTNVSINREFAQSLTLDEQMYLLKERLQQVNMFSPNANIKQVRGFVELWKMNSQMVLDYTSEETLSCPITLFRAKESIAETFDEPTWGWQDFSDKPVEVYLVPGSHITMMNAPHVAVLAENLQRCLNQAQT